MHEGPDWRDQFYATEIKEVLASIEKIDKGYRRGINVYSIPETMQILPETAPTPSSFESQTLIGSSLSTVTSPFFTGGYSLATQPSSITSPESSSSELTASPSSNDVLRCPKCLEPFHGSARASNLNRHMRRTRGCGNTAGCPCPKPGCGMVLSRSDNLGQHIKTVHGGDTDAVVGETGARKRRKYTESTE